MPDTCSIPDGYEIAPYPFGESFLATKPFMLPVWDELEAHCPRFHAERLMAFGRRKIEDIHFSEVQALRMNANTPMYVDFNSLMSLLEVQIRVVQAYSRDTIPFTTFIKEA